MGITGEEFKMMVGNLQRPYIIPIEFEIKKKIV